MLTDLVYLLSNSILRAATNQPRVLKSWVRKVEEYVLKNGKFTKFETAYTPVAPPPFFWNYVCGRCRWFIPPNRCLVVEGDIRYSAWCALWVPPNGKKPFSWVEDIPEDLSNLLKDIPDTIKSPLGREKVLPLKHL